MQPSNYGSLLLSDSMGQLLALTLTTLVLSLAPATAAEPQKQPPFNYVWGKAYHILPETHNEESGYFSLSEGQDGSLYIGTAKYGVNAYLVEFDPRTQKQHRVLDTNKVCGLTAKGYAAQAKIHTRNFVGASGLVYVGSKQGYARKGDTLKYPGGYVMTYDPRTGLGRNLGMPYKGQGVIDVVADEGRDLLYVVTCENQHWMLYNTKVGNYRELGPILTPYATTLIDGRGRANAITKDFELAQFDPQTGRITVRPIRSGSHKLTRANSGSIPTWNLAADGHTAYLILMNDPRLLAIDLYSTGPFVKSVSYGQLIEGQNPDSRCALSIAPDGRVYTLVRVDNETGLGKGYLHHLLRFDPPTGKAEDLGVLAVKNPDFFAFGPGPDGKPKPWTHGFHRLPDGTLTPLHAHMSLLVTRDGTIYTTLLYPFTLLKIDTFKPTPPRPSPGQLYLDSMLTKIDQIEAQLPQITRVAEIMADRHLKGGLIGLPRIGSTLEEELIGRSGGIMHIGFDRPWKKDRTKEEKANDLVILAWDRRPRPGDLSQLQPYKKRGIYVIGFGPEQLPELSEHVKACDVWFDTGMGRDDRIVQLSQGRRAGKTNHVINVLSGWALTAEFVAALTRRGKMPTMWKSWGLPDGQQWSEQYFGKKQFHDDYQVKPIPAGKLAQTFFKRMRYLLRKFGRTQMTAVRRAAEQIVAEWHAGRKTMIASSGHMAMNFVAQYDDTPWAINHEVHHHLKWQIDNYAQETPDGALVLRLGAGGLHKDLDALFKKKQQRVLVITSKNPRPAWRLPAGYEIQIDMGYAFGDACVTIEGYPIQVLPPSGIMQAVAYECVNTEVLSKLTE